MKRTVTKFVCDQRQFEEARGRDGENIRAWIRLLCTGDVDAKAPFPGKPLSTSYLVTGDTRKDRAARRAAAKRLLKKAAPCFARKPTLKDLYDRFFPDFLRHTSRREPVSSRWNDETISQNARMAERYLIAIYEKITLPPDEADAYLFRQLLFQAAKTKDQYDRLLNLHRQFMTYLAWYAGISIPALDGAAPVRSGPERRRNREGALPPRFWDGLAPELLEQLRRQTPQAGVALGMLAMFCMGLRSREVLALSLGALCRSPCPVQAEGACRRIPVVGLLRQAADGQVAALCRRLGISRETALGYPVTGAEQDEARMMEQADFAAKAREIFLALGVQEEALQAYSGLMDEMKGDGAEQEVNVCAYILRRDYITRLYNHTALSQQMISYLAGHAQADQKPYRPNDAELAAARLALEQAFSAAPCADGAAPVTVCCSVHTLAPGEILQITAAERGDPMVVTITGEPGTAVDVVLAQRLDPPEDAPVCRNTIHV